MDPQSLELSKAAARAALPYAIGLGVAYLLIGLIPCLGGCVNFFLTIGSFLGLGYLLTPRLTDRFPAGQSQTTLALYIGAGVAVALTAAFVVANIITGLLGMALSTAISSLNDTSGFGAFGAATRGVAGLILVTIGVTFWGLLVGTGLGFLGSYLAFNRSTTVQGSARPF